MNTRINSAHYQEGGTWKLQTSASNDYEFDVVINAIGNQHTPLFPDVPEVAKIAGHLTVLQRSANWVMPRGR